MPLPDPSRLREYTRKGLDLAGRQVGLAPEQRQGRRLGRSVSDHLADHPNDGAGPRVLFLTPRDWAFHVQFEAILAAALQLRGAEVRFLTCGGGLELCDRVNTHEAPPLPCTSCTRYVEDSLDALGHQRVSLRSKWEPVDPGRWTELDGMGADELPTAEAEGLPLGQLMDIPSRWFLLAARLEQDPLGTVTQRDLLSSARRMAIGFRRQIEDWRPDIVVMLNGLFSFESVARAICRAEDIDVVTYERTHRRGALVFNRETPANRYDLSGIWATRGVTPLSDDENEALDEYLVSRREQGHPLLDIWKDAVEDRPDRPTDGRLVTLFSNVTWDSSVLGRDVAFSSMHHWLDAAVQYFIDHPQHRLIVRAHPAEAKRSGKWTREPITTHLSERFGPLPENIRVIGPDDPTSSYPLMEESDIGLVYTSTVGIEMAVMGKPVLVSGRSHYRDLGFTNDASSPADFEARLDHLLADPSAGVGRIDLARRYAYAFFFDAPIPAPLVDEPYPGLARHTVERVDELLPGVNTDLDRICDGILGRLGSDQANRYFLAADTSE
ncbi:MAG: hypothetical protein ACR2QE_10680 [Acidimicrobiales bacterium]